MLPNLNNYGDYQELVRTGKQTVDIKTINPTTYAMHFNSILNIMKDGIETEEVQNMLITCHFDVIDVDLYIEDYWFNLIMWRLMVCINKEIRPKNIFFPKYIRGYEIKNYIDTMFLEIYRTKFKNITLNNAIDDCLWGYSYIQFFEDYLSNSFDESSFLKLWNDYPETKEIMMMDLGNGNDVDYSTIMPTGQTATNKLLDYIEMDDHCLANFVRAAEGLSAKQFKEVAVHHGIKPDGNGGIVPYVLNTNFMMGGVNRPDYYTIESSVGRIAQMIVKGNTGTSGAFARILKLNNADTTIHPDPTYDCCTANYTRFHIDNNKELELWENSWYKESPKGIEKLITLKDTHLIGKTIWLRTPMTCASHARGEGICYKCYGNLAYTNNDISAGTISAEILSAIMTQMQLSAKHLLEAKVIALRWEIEFENFFSLDGTLMRLEDTKDFSGWTIRINSNNIDLVVEEDGGSDEDQQEETNIYSEYITEFELVSPKGEVLLVRTADDDNMYITPELNKVIRKYASASDDDYISIPADKLEEIHLFMVKINNNELDRLLSQVNALVNKGSEVEKKTREEWIKDLMDICIEGKLHIMGVHLSVILSNQIRDKDNILEKVDWRYPDPEYQLLSLGKSLTNYPDVTVSLSYQNIGKMLYNPLTYKKHGCSYMNLFFHKNPQSLINGTYEEHKILDKNNPKEGISF